MAKKKSESDPAPPEEPKAPLRTPKHIQFPCMTFKQGKHTLILFVASAKALWDLVKINKREEDKNEGYQRALSPARADKIAQFIDAENVLPGSVLISFDDDTKLTKDRDAIVIPNRADAGWVIDGQHRLAGASRSEQERHLSPLLSPSSASALTSKSTASSPSTVSRSASRPPSTMSCSSTWAPNPRPRSLRSGRPTWRKN